jgi:NAD(P) transhydrogenase subunit beta
VHEFRVYLVETLKATELAYLVATAGFILALYWMNNPATARRGVFAGVIAMALGMLGAALDPHVTHWVWVLGAIGLGFVVGVPLSWVPLTAVPQRTALSHAFGGLAVGLLGMAKFYDWLYAPADHKPLEMTGFVMGALVAEVLLGFLTFTGSLMAAGKLQEIKWIPQRPVTYPFQNVINFGLLATAVLCGLALIIWKADVAYLFPLIVILALAFGVLLIIPIGGADMPTVISLLNSYAGLSAVALGFVLNNKLLITAGALDGSSGLILSIIMCRAMNRSFFNVLFGAFGQVQSKAAGGEARTVKSETPEGAAQIMEQANLVVIVPGYGMAVAQAQHRVKELFDLLTKRGVDVRFAIHPVAGRMPGHMNVLLAESEIPYDKLVEMDDINHDLPQADVCLVIGANDVVNPAARHDKSSPIYGMPIIDADKARTCFAIKRSMNPGFAGIENELYYGDRTYMLFGDAKAVVGELVKALSGSGGGH